MWYGIRNGAWCYGAMVFVVGGVDIWRSVRMCRHPQTDRNVGHSVVISTLQSRKVIRPWLSTASFCHTVSFLIIVFS